ncbi:MAG TPA: glycosyltransferase [Myxococcales bacterium]|nr:glycosyltransferase [Myxococcales bacterium]
MARLKFSLLLGFCAVLLALVLVAAFVLPAPWSWSIGLVYIGYDTWLLGYMVFTSYRALRRPAGLAMPLPRPSLSVVIAARNERRDLPLALDAILSEADQPDEILVVDDGSTDGTAQMLAERYAGRVRVLAKPNSGKARSLNQALAAVASDVFVTIDADTIIEPGSIAAIRDAFAADPALVAGCGVLKPVVSRAPLGRAFELYQTFEYLRGFLWRVSWSRANVLVLVSGAFAAFRRERLAEIGGFDPRSLVEDYEVMFRLHRRSYEDRGEPLRARVIAGARATTDSPGKLRVFLRQRTRWFAGYIETMFRSGDMVFGHLYGRLGSFHLPIKTVDMLLPVYGFFAVVALIAQICVGLRPTGIVLYAIIFKLCYDLACHFISIFLNARWLGRKVTPRFAVRAIFATITEPIGFQFIRQLGALLGWVAFLRGRIEWHPQRTSESTT